MPDLTFVLPHWLYWALIALVPIAAIVCTLQAARRPSRRRTSLSVAWLFLLCGGFMGLHRLYLRHWAAGIFLLLFVFILYANFTANQQRNVLSSIKNELAVKDYLYKKAVESGDNNLSQLAHERAMYQQRHDSAKSLHQSWLDRASYAWYLTLFLMLTEVFFIPRRARFLRTIEQQGAPPQKSALAAKKISLGDAYSGSSVAPTMPVRWQRQFVITVDVINHAVGQYIAFWTLLAVFVFYSEVVMRYVFNSPTNWAHESMFLVFGMQYLLAGGFAMKENAHVRVDVFYMRFSPRAKALTDLLTSVFFFLYAITMSVTGWIFFHDAFSTGEVSFTEWGISYWPAKMTIAAGGLLLLLQGAAQFLRNLDAVRNSNPGRSP